MRILKSSKDFLEIQLPSEANRDLGLFLIFFGVAGVFPLQYIAGKFIELPWKGWTLAVYLSVLFVLIGLHLILNSKKNLSLTPLSLTIKDGLFHRPITYRWKETPSIRLKRMERISRSVPVEDWLVYLMDGRYEYVIERRSYNQLEMRALAEELAKFLGASLVDDTGEDGRIVIEAADLDLPFLARIKKYPQLLGPSVRRPSRLLMKVSDIPDGREYSWGIATAGFLMEILLVSVFLLLLTFIPWGAEELSFYDWSRLKDNYLFYNGFILVVPAIILIIAGYRATFRVNHKALDFRESFWGVPFLTKRILLSRLEEIRYQSGLRGPVFQAFSDSTIISFRVPDTERARWLTSEVRCFISGECVPEEQ